MSKIKKYKWKIHWAAFVLLVLLFIFSAIFFEDKSWIANLLQSIGTIAGIYLTIIIFLHSKEESDKQFREQLEHLQALNEKQISALQYLTEKQIEALNKATIEQISSFEMQIKEVTNKLSDNSILLAEILGRELEKSIEVYNSAVQNEKAKYKNLSQWKLLRTPEEREQQLKNQLTRIEKLKQGFEYLVNKYNQVRQYLGYKEQEGLNE